MIIYNTQFLLQGMPGAPGMKMYSRDELMNMKNFGGENEDDDEDEEDDGGDTGFRSKLVHLSISLIVIEMCFFFLSKFHWLKM
jgi:hypothetical protein